MIHEPLGGLSSRVNRLNNSSAAVSGTPAGLIASQTSARTAKRLRHHTRRHLLRLQAELAQEPGHCSRELGNTDSVAGTSASQTDATQTLEQLGGQVREPEAALSPREQGEYDQCLDCDRLIPAERLRANPAIERCRSCQERYDRQARSRRRPPREW